MKLSLANLFHPTPTPTPSSLLHRLLHPRNPERLPPAPTSPPPPPSTITTTATTTSTVQNNITITVHTTKELFYTHNITLFMPTTITLSTTVFSTVTLPPPASTPPPATASPTIPAAPLSTQTQPLSTPSNGNHLSTPMIVALTLLPLLLILLLSTLFYFCCARRWARRYRAERVERKRAIVEGNPDAISGAGIGGAGRELEMGHVENMGQHGKQGGGVEVTPTPKTPAFRDGGAFNLSQRVGKTTPATGNNEPFAVGDDDENVEDERRDQPRDLLQPSNTINGGNSFSRPISWSGGGGTVAPPTVLPPPPAYAPRVGAQQAGGGEKGGAGDGGEEKRGSGVSTLASWEK